MTPSTSHPCNSIIVTYLEVLTVITSIHNDSGWLSNGLGVIDRRQYNQLFMASICSDFLYIIHYAMNVYLDLHKKGLVTVNYVFLFIHTTILDEVAPFTFFWLQWNFFLCRHNYLLLLRNRKLMIYLF